MNENFTTNLFYNAGITVKHCLPYKWELSLRTLYFSPEGVLPMSSSLPPSASLSNVSRIKSCFQISSHISFSRIEKCVCQFRKGGLASHLAHCNAIFLWCLWATNYPLTWRESQLVFSTWRIASLRTCSPTCNNMAIITVSRQCKAMARPRWGNGNHVCRLVTSSALAMIASLLVFEKELRKRWLAGPAFVFIFPFVCCELGLIIKVWCLDLATGFVPSYCTPAT